MSLAQSYPDRSGYLNPTGVTWQHHGSKELQASLSHPHWDAAPLSQSWRLPWAPHSVQRAYKIDYIPSILPYGAWQALWACLAHEKMVYHTLIYVISKMVQMWALWMPHHRVYISQFPLRKQKTCNYLTKRIKYKNNKMQPLFLEMVEQRENDGIIKT